MDGRGGGASDIGRSRKDQRDKGEMLEMKGSTIGECETLHTATKS